MTIGAESIFVFAGFIILVGFIGEQIFRKTNVPSFLFLILIGVVIGPVLRLITRNVLTPILGTVAEFTLIMVLFYGGMEINFKALLDSSGRAIAQVFFYVSIAISLITIFVNVFLGWSLIQSLIFGAIVGGETTTIVVFKLADYIGIKEKTAVFLKLEAALNSIVLVVLFVTFVGLYQTGSANIYSAMLGLSSNFSIGVVVGLILSIIWLSILNKVKKYKYTYVLTLGFLLLTYSFTQIVNGSGILAALIFGVVVGNNKFIASLLKRRTNLKNLEKQLHTLQGEITFLLSTFFFVFLGIVFSISLSSLEFGAIVGAIILLILLFSRYLATSISTIRSEISADKKYIIMLLPQGLTPATLAILALSYGIPLASTFLVLVTYVIIFTNVVATVGVFAARRGA
ncbi:cation:proton antiporter [Candidatus Parvarchaeota archaeon]|nr:cation:proton antiporter [Candidatus Parvarchaeota archaeon]